MRCLLEKVIGHMVRDTDGLWDLSSAKGVGNNNHGGIDAVED